MNFEIRKYFFALGLIFLVTQLINAQDQKLADSLATIYETQELQGLEKMELLRKISFNESNDLHKALEYAEELIKIANSENNYLYLYRGYLQKGNKNFQMGNFEIALDVYFKAAEAAIKADYPAGEGSAYMAIADVYSDTNDSDNASNYYKKAIEILRKADNPISLASVLLNAGDEEFINGNYALALSYFEESGEIFKNENFTIGIAYNMGNIGKVNHAQGDYEKAKTNLSRAIALLKEVNDDYGISDYAIYLSDVFEKQNDLPAALTFAKTGLELSSKLGLKDQISDANFQLSELYELLGDKDLALKYYKTYILNRDSLQNIEAVQQMANLRTNYEVSQKQIEVDLLNQQKSNQRIVVIATSIALFLIGLLAFGLYRRYRFIRKTSLIIENEKKRSESLLLNILPEETASELKKHGKVKAKKFNEVTVMFTDFVGFTRSSENLSPEQLVESVDYFFSKFDEIIEKYELEKIKTIGDAYMCACGLHVSKKNHTVNALNAAFEIVDFMKKSKSNKDIMPFDVRIGINTGPVVAGVVGTKKFAYDIWGDTVNVAARMESNSEPGKINISENTYSLIKDTFVCEPRGELDVKNRGKMKMYFVQAQKDLESAPNHKEKRLEV